MFRLDCRRLFRLFIRSGLDPDLNTPSPGHIEVSRAKTMEGRRDGPLGELVYRNHWRHWRVPWLGIGSINLPRITMVPTSVAPNSAAPT